MNKRIRKKHRDKQLKYMMKIAKALNAVNTSLDRKWWKIKNANSTVEVKK